jgi:hypothetical protein
MPKRKSFKIIFDGASEKVLRAFMAIIEDKLLALGSIEVALIAESIYHPNTNSNNRFNAVVSYMPTLSVGVIFLSTAATFILYDRLVKRRQRLLWTTAAQSTSIVSALFPSRVRDQLMKENTPIKQRRESLSTNTRMLKSFVTNIPEERQEILRMQPIADTFPHATVLFADIAGLTAWSSARNPTDVFKLLQSLYLAFDELASRYNVWKVETIGMLDML